MSNEYPIDFMKYNNTSVFGATQVAESEIGDIIDNFNDSATGWDKFKPKVINSVKIPLTRPYQ